MKTLVRLLIWIGLTRRLPSGKLFVPFHIPPKHMVVYYWKCERKPYLFRNLKSVIKWTDGRLLPRRWGVGWLGFEFGDRG